MFQERQLNMNQRESLELLGLSDVSNVEEIEKAYKAKKEELEQCIQDAPSPEQKKEYVADLEDLVQAKMILVSNFVTVLDEGNPYKDHASSIQPFCTHHGLPSDLTNDAKYMLKEGQVLLDRYEIRHRLGAGGMGAVFAAFDRNRGEEIAIKVLLPSMLNNELIRDRFLSEAKISSSLSHPNIINVFDVQKDNDVFFITMELLEGKTLRTEMVQRDSAKKPFEVDKALKIAQSLCDALEYAHKYTVHRDVKPENIWLGKDGTVKLMDFGIARVMRTSQFTMTGIAIGTAYYMAPEQLKGTRDIDHRADQYSVAVLLYEMLTGAIPTGRVRSVRQMRRDVPSKMSMAIDRALSAKPQNRFANMPDFYNALASKGLSIDFKKIAIAALILLAVGGIYHFFKNYKPAPEEKKKKVAIKPKKKKTEKISKKPLIDETVQEMRKAKAKAEEWKKKFRLGLVRESNLSKIAENAFQNAEKLRAKENNQKARFEYIKAQTYYDEALKDAKTSPISPLDKVRLEAEKLRNAVSRLVEGVEEGRYKIVDKESWLKANRYTQRERTA